MRSGSLARAVMASLGVSVVITPGCGPFPPGPSPVRGRRRDSRYHEDLFPHEEDGIVGATVAKITGNRISGRRYGHR